ncbi:MAG: hypothetical protein KJ955_00585 [Nanoarchaeota archaeon]|nr:hypothetical protein [Nanoarchaeota archaeon]
MAKKAMEGPKAKCLTGRKTLLFLGAVFFGALGFAAMIQGILLQVSLGFAYGFFAYLLALISLGAAKCLKWKAYENCCPSWHMMKH